MAEFFSPSTGPGSLILFIIISVRCCATSVCPESPVPPVPAVDNSNKSAIDVSFFVDGNRNIIQFTWTGYSDDVRSGFNFSLKLRNGCLFYLGRMDWLGFHKWDASQDFTGDMFLIHGPRLQGKNNTSEVYASGFLILPYMATGEFQIDGYGARTTFTILPRTEIAVLADLDKSALAPYAIRCLPPSATPDPNFNGGRKYGLLRWWHRGYPLVSVEWHPERGAEGRVRWESASDAIHSYYVNPYTGDIHVFDRPTLVRLTCLRCTLQGEDYATNSRLSCQDQGDDLPIPFDFEKHSGAMSPEERFRMDILRNTLIVVTWIVGAIALLAAVTVLVGNALALCKDLSCSCFPRILGRDEKGGPVYKQLDSYPV
nr:membrane protein m166 [Mastomys natalensis cytomegalovirus 3]WEG69988.1 membrane protein m166 [Mastomys natalensis cytomegalovirus 3]WEG70128.1 membrane protein m166 [Mastomys natalensis cytomegalovirus 3]WEG70268.1 membrane protein m166 [Mastomys natalensis cytomegalovirus 3]WEG70408.1 membrane protein m166 [Mastomys natalensis cytomegalovirus 3]